MLYSIHLTELSPSSIRIFAVGSAYHIGALVAAASATIEATIGDRFPLPPGKNGVARYDYGRVICIFLGAVSAPDVGYWGFAADLHYIGICIQLRYDPHWARTQRPNNACRRGRRDCGCYWQSSS